MMYLLYNLLIGVVMLKKIVVGVMSISMLITSMPSYAGPFGRSSSKSSTSSAKRSSVTPSRSSTTISAPSTPKRDYTASRDTGGISKGGSVGMTRTDVTNRVRDNSYKQTMPANNTTVAGRAPETRYNNNTRYNNDTRYSDSRRYNDRYDNDRRYNNNNYNMGGYNNGYRNPSRYGIGTVLTAAAAGALLGYIMHSDNNGNTYFTHPNNPNMAYNGEGQALNAIPNGNFQPAGMVNNDGTIAALPASYNAQAPMVNPVSIAQQRVTPVVAAQTAPVVVDKSGFSGWWIILLLLALGAMVYMMFLRKKDKGEAPTMNNILNPKNPEEQLRDDAEKMFMNFQKNNRPSQVEYIRQNSTPLFFDAVKDTVMDSSEDKVVSINTLEHEVVDVTQSGTKYIASIRYRSLINENDGGADTETNVDEVWHYVYENKRWLVAGIEQV